MLRKVGATLMKSSIAQVFTVIGAFLIALVTTADAQTVNLQCSGTFYSYYAQPPMQGAVENATVTVDFDAKQVSGFYPKKYPITRIDEQTIVFSMDVDNGAGSALGNIDRTTGKTLVVATRRDQPSQMLFLYQLMCVPV